MFNGFSKKTTEFLSGIRENNNKEWFEKNKDIYLSEVYEPLCALAEEISAQFSEIPDIVCKASRIYQDASFPPYEHYRSTMWIYILHNDMYWSRMPVMYVELSADSIVCGVKMSSPQPFTMENYRKALNDNPDKFIEIFDRIKAKYSISVAGEEYKKEKPCSNILLKKFISRKKLYIYTTITGKDMYSKNLAQTLTEMMADFFPLEEYFLPFTYKPVDAEVIKQVMPDFPDELLTIDSNDDKENENSKRKKPPESSPIAEKYGGFMW